MFEISNFAAILIPGIFIGAAVIWIVSIILIHSNAKKKN